MDDASIDGSGSGSADALVPLGPWSAPEVIDIPAVADDDPSATGDGLELYFNRATDIYVTKRASRSDPWSAPAAVTELNTLDAETTPEVSYDGLTIYFASNRAGTLGDYDIWRSTRASRTAPWSSPLHVNELCSAQAEGAPTQTDPSIILIDSARVGSQMLDIYMATRPGSSGAFEAPTAIAELNSAESEGNPMYGAGKLTIYLDSNRSGNGEVYAATRASAADPFSPPAPIAELSNAGNDTDPWISPDGRTLYFTSDRDGTQRLWQTTR